MTTYLSITEVLDINKGFIGPDQLRDLGLLDAAAMRPQSSAFGADAFPAHVIPCTERRLDGMPLAPTGRCTGFHPSGGVESSPGTAVARTRLRLD